MNFFPKILVAAAIFCSCAFAGENQKGLNVYSEREIAAWYATHNSREMHRNCLRENHKKRKINVISHSAVSSSSSSDDMVYETSKSKSPTSLSSISIEESSSHEEIKTTVEQTSSSITLMGTSYNSSKNINFTLEMIQKKDEFAKKTIRLLDLPLNTNQLEAQHKNVHTGHKNTNTPENKLSAKEKLHAKRQLLSKYNGLTEQALKNQFYCAGLNMNQVYVTEGINKRCSFVYCCQCQTLEIISKEQADNINVLEHTCSSSFKYDQGAYGTMHRQ